MSSVGSLEPGMRPHRRYNPLRKSWVLVSPQRTERPWQGQTSKAAAPVGLHYDPQCYLCPGNTRAGGKINPAYTGTFEFDNDYPALLPDDGSGTAGDHADGLLVRESEHGRCRVVCFDPDHSLTLAGMPESSIERVVEAWQQESATLGADPSIGYVQIFQNSGAMMGASNPHPHCQIWATGHVPDEPAAEGAAQKEYLLAHGTGLLSDYLRQELAAGERVLTQNEEFAVVVPYWAVWPFETILLPKRPVSSFIDFSAAQVTGLADVLKRLTMTYDRVFAISFPYTMGFHQRPLDREAGAYPEWQFHGHFYPPLLRSAEIRKFMVGFEMLGMPQRDITPEGAAATLRKAGEGIL